MIMKRFKTHLTREYIIEIIAESEEQAKELTELYVSGGFDESSESVRLKEKFQILAIKPSLNEVWMVEENDDDNTDNN